MTDVKTPAPSSVSSTPQQSPSSMPPSTLTPIMPRPSLPSMPQVPKPVLVSPVLPPVSSNAKPPSSLPTPPLAPKAPVAPVLAQPAPTPLTTMFPKTPIAPLAAPISSATDIKLPNPTLPAAPKAPVLPTAASAPSLSSLPKTPAPPIRPASAMPPAPPTTPSSIAALNSLPKPSVAPTLSTMAAANTVPPLRPASLQTPMTPPARPAASPLPPLRPPQQAPLPKPPLTPPSSTPPQPAEYKQSPLRFLPFVLGGLLILGIGYFIFSKLFGGGTPAPTTGGTSSQTGTNGQTGGILPGSQPVTITYWGLWEPSTVTQQVFDNFQQAHPNIKVNYQQQSYQDYRERLQTAIANGTGPDVFRFHATWTPMLASNLSPMPTSVISPTDFQNIFYPVASQQLTLNGQIMGVPLMYDGLALYYNVDALNSANAQPPATWADTKTLASQLTIRSNGKIQRAGMAIGNASNVEHFSDILGLLMLQNGADPSNPTSQAAQDAMTFYTNFVKVDKVWDDTFPSSTQAFARGDVAMMLAPSWRVHDIQALNPNLKFKIAPVPQLAANKITWASYWAEGVSVQSQHKNEAWQLLQYMSSPDVLRKFYSSASTQRAFGEIYPRRDMANDLASQTYASPYLADAPNAQSWYLTSYTHDNGIDDFIIKYYQDAVNAVLSGTDVAQAMNTVAQGTAQVLRQYGLQVGATNSNTTGATGTAPTNTSSNQ